MKRYGRRNIGCGDFLSAQISITSKSAAGRSTLLEGLEQEFKALGLQFMSVGSIFREWAASRGQSIEDFARYNLEHPEAGFDRRADETIAKRAEWDMMVAEGRLVHVFMPRAFHVLLVCPVQTRAERRHRQLQKKSPQANRAPDYGRVLKDILQRDADDAERYEDLYPGCQWPPKDYDLVVDTGVLEPHETRARVTTEHRAWLERNHVPR